MKRFLVSVLAGLFAGGVAMADDSAVIKTVARNSWKLQNEVVSLALEFKGGKLTVGSMKNLEAGVDYLAGSPAVPLFTHIINGAAVTADDGGWTLADAAISDIELYGKKWGRRLEVTLSRNTPVLFQVRQIFEVYNGRAGLRLYSYLKNPGKNEVTISESSVAAFGFPDKPHHLNYIEGKLKWVESTGSLTNGGRNCIGRYDTGDGWVVVPENNWATCLAGGKKQGDQRHKLMSIQAFVDKDVVRVVTNPESIQLVLMPGEDVEYFSVNLGVFKGTAMDGRMAVSEHLRMRFKFHDPSRFLSTNDWQWHGWRTDANYRNIVIPAARDAGFDRIHIDDFWYAPEDSTDPKGNWTDMPALCDLIIKNGMKPGHWFSLQGKYCINSWANGRDCADPQNVAFKMKQCEEILIGKYHTAWDQIDAGLLWKTDTKTTYSSPSDSVYRKILGLRTYMNTLAHKYPDLIMQTTCEIDNPMDGHQNENVGLIHLADNGVAGYYLRTDSKDNVRDMFETIGLFPLEGMMVSWGEGKQSDAWQDSPLWYYQFLLARHASIYSWPGDWSKVSIAHLRLFNDWRKNPRIKAVLNELIRPVYNGSDWMKNEGPWAWMYTNKERSKALLIALNHLNLSGNDSFAAKLYWLDADKTYLVEEITQLPDARCNYKFRGEFTGALLKTQGLPIDLGAGVEPCAAFWIQEKASGRPHVLYADSAVVSYSEKRCWGGTRVQLQGAGNATARLIVYKPEMNGVESRDVKLDPSGAATVDFDRATISQAVQEYGKGITGMAEYMERDVATAGSWNGRYGRTAAWLAGGNVSPTNGYVLQISRASTYAWGKDDKTARVLALPAGETGSKRAACWTAENEFSLSVRPASAEPYKLTVYIMDYDNGKRAMELGVKVRDGRVLGVQRADRSETEKGVYLSWKVTGPVTLQARKTEGCNAAVSAVFVDPLP